MSSIHLSADNIKSISVDSICDIHAYVRIGTVSF